MPDRDARTRFATGSRRGDLWVFAALATLIVAGGFRLRVYHTVAAVWVEAAAVLADGSLRSLELPRALERSGSAAYPLDEVLARTERRVRAHAAETLEALPPGTRLAYRIRFGVDATRLEGKRTLRFPEADDAGG